MLKTPHKSRCKINQRINQTNHPKRLLPSALLLCLASSALLLFGQATPSNPRTHAPAEAKPSAKILQKFDADGNGVLDPAEKEALHKDIIARLGALRAKSLQRHGTNQNGVLDPQEKAARDQARAAQLERLRSRELARNDANKNGVLDPEEKETIRQHREAFLKKINDKALERYDVNRNGVLDPEEREALHAAAAAHRQATLDKYDKNHDGRLDEAERAAAITDVQKAKTPKK